MKKLIKIVLPIVLVIAILLPIFSCLGLTGKFYSLRDAYNNGFITKEELQTIADMHNNGQGRSEVDSLSFTVKKSIESSWARGLRKKYDRDIKARDVAVGYYYGEYNGYYVCILIDGYHTDEFMDLVLNIDDVKMYFSHIYYIKRLVVYKRF